MKRYFELTGWCLALLLVVPNSSADNYTKALHIALAEIDSSTDRVDLIGYQSVEHLEPDDNGLTKYIILDFRAGEQDLHEEEMVTNVGQICSLIISNRPLIRNLSSLGYDMVSVAFDDFSQFDCL